MRGRYDELRHLGAEVLAVSFTRPERVAAYLERHPLPFPALCDPERTAYRDFGLGQTSWREMLRPGVLAGYLRLVLRGWIPEKSGPGEDVLQLGGDFVLDGRRRLVYAYRSKGPADRPPADDLVRAVRSVL